MSGWIARLNKLAFGGLCVGALAISSLPARAEEPLNLVGTCKGIAQGVHRGTNPYRAGEQPGPNFSTEALEFTYTITTQHGNRFSGQSSDGKRTENLIGAITQSNKNGVVLDDDGQYLFTVRDSNTLDACYSHSNANSKVAACFEWKRIR
ncbi:hypothetical protein BH10PSE6_BH10PSE6_15180 [soil metagenome]